MRRLWWILAVIVVLAAVLAFALWLKPLPSGVPLAWLVAGAASAAIIAAIFTFRRKPKVRPVPEGPKPIGPDREFLPAALEIIETPPSPIAIGFLWFICLAFSVGLVWAWIAKLDIHVTAAGSVQPSGRSKVLQAADSGRVMAVHAENGSRVAAGQLLIELDATESRADAQSTERELAAVDADVARRSVAITVIRAKGSQPLPIAFPGSTPPDLRVRETDVLAAELSRLTSQISTVMAEALERRAQQERLKIGIEAREKLLAVLEERVAMRNSLADQKVGARASVIDALQELRREETTNAIERGQLHETEVSITSLERRLEQVRAEFIADNALKSAEASRRRDLLAKDLVKADYRNQHTRLTAPISGTVQQLSVTTIGQVVSSGQPLLTIVPERAVMEVEAMIQNQDVGFVREGQSVIIKVEAFPFTRFGTLTGIVRRISRDAVQSSEAQAGQDTVAATGGTASPLAGTPIVQGLVFPATVTLSQSVMEIDGARIPLSPGMAVSVEIKTGERRAIDYVLSPLREIGSEAARER
jgi:hemolysin D